MRATFSYANILHAVGQVLDQIGVKSIAIHEEEDGFLLKDSTAKVNFRHRFAMMLLAFTS